MKQLELPYVPTPDVADDFKFLQIPTKLQGTVYAYIDGLVMVETEVQNTHFFLTVVNLLRQNPNGDSYTQSIADKYIAAAARAYLSYREMIQIANSDEPPF